MALKQTVICDVTGVELKGRDLVEMTTVNVTFNEVAVRQVKDPESGEIEDRRMVIGQDIAAFHICPDHSKDFMAHMQEYFDKKEDEIKNGAEHDFGKRKAKDRKKNRKKD